MPSQTTTITTCAKENAYQLQSLLSFTQTLWQRVSSLKISPSSSSSLAATATSTTKITTELTLSFKLWLLFLLLLDVPLFCNCVGYSYSRFVGPVTGPEEKVAVRDAQSGIGNVDYVAHPKYQFAYGVEDSEHRMLQNRKETRDGDNVHGVYSVLDPDGSLRVVKYTADNVHGFQAEVITNGIPVIYGHKNLNEHAQGNGYWKAELPTDTESGEDYAGEGEDDNDDNDDDVDDDDENEYDGSSEVGSSEEDFEDAEDENI